MKLDSFVVLCQLCNDRTQVEELELDQIDWDELWHLSLRHRVVPVMAERIKQLGLAVPDEIHQRIDEHVHDNLIKGMGQAAELVRLTSLFQKNAIPFVFFKGIALIKLMGLELHQRHHGDVDLLLANFEDLDRADAVLKEEGYQRITLVSDIVLNPPQQKYFKQYEKDVVYYHPLKKLQLELHFKLCQSTRLLPVSPQEYYKNREEINIGSHKIPVMSQLDHQLYLLVHGATSRWFRLKWLCDIPLISNNGVGYSSPAFRAQAEALGVNRVVSLGVRLAHELLSMRVPGDRLSQQERGWVASLLYTIAKQNLTGKDFNYFNMAEKLRFWPVYTLVYMPSLRKEFAYKVDHFKSYLTRVTDWEACPLPSALFFLYFPLRPFIWFKRQFSS